MTASRLPEPLPQRPAPGARTALLVLAGVFLLAALLQLGLTRLEGTTPRPLSGDEKLYVAVATAWAAGEPAELDPLWPPGYPATLALWLRGGGSLAGVSALQFLALLVAGGALASIARAAGAAREVAVLAGSLLVLDPEIAAFARLFWPEVLHLALLLVALRLAIHLLPENPAKRAEPAAASARSRRALATCGWLLFGAVLGSAIALKSLLLPFAPLLVLALARAPSARERIARGLLVLLPFLLVLAPVVLFEHSRNGAWGLGGSARFNLWVGLNDRSPRSLVADRAWSEYLLYRESGPTFAERQRVLTERLRDLVRTRGLPAVLTGQFPRQYFRLFDRESYFSAMLPPDGSRYLAGEGYRNAPPSLARFFGHFEVLLYAAILIGAPFGLVRLVRERRRGARWIVGLLVYELALFYFVHVQSRYRLTLLPLLILGAVWTVETVGRRGREGELAISRADLALGGAGAAALLFFAFGVP